MNSPRREPVMEKKGEEVLQYFKRYRKHGIVPGTSVPHRSEINHGIADIDQSPTVSLSLTEDSCIPFRKGGAPARRYRPVDVPLPPLCGGGLCQRLNRDNLDLVQLNSFGCGLDAVTTDQVSDIPHPIREDLYGLKDRRGSTTSEPQGSVSVPSSPPCVSARSALHEKYRVQLLQPWIFTKEMKRTTRCSARRCPRSTSSSSNRRSAASATTSSFSRTMTRQPWIRD